ncbi:MAG: hypothetical protein IT306_23670 [Chloroflexi bacterium]|nr:hypothetical protein [Chloroflexota bacterium]
MSFPLPYDAAGAVPPLLPPLPSSAAAAAPGIDLARLRRALCDVGQVTRIEQLGQSGPPLASAGSHSLFHCLFGRDSLRMSLDLLSDFPLVARATLLALAGLQGVRTLPRAEEEPGRILHEHRQLGDPLLPELERFWTFPYYGAVDSTPQWIHLLAAHAELYGDAILAETVIDRLGQARTLLDAMEAALGWIVSRLDNPVGGGYLWVRRAHPHGIPNQVWEDSADSYYHADGVLFDVTRPYAPVAVQGYVYDALLGAAELSERTPAAAGRPLLEPATLRQRAADLRERFLAQFWQPDLGTFALALTFDGDPPSPGRPARVIASSPGHLLASRLLDGDDVASLRGQLIARLFQPDMLAGAGIRTRWTGSPRFRAGSYHNGSTWPMDTGVIADGLRRHGVHALADELESRILAGCGQAGAFPEFFRGDPDGSIAINVTTLDVLQDGVTNRLEQPPQMEQGWTITRVWSILRRRGAIAAV